MIAGNSQRITCYFLSMDDIIMYDATRSCGETAVFYLSLVVVYFPSRMMTHS